MWGELALVRGSRRTTDVSAVSDLVDGRILRYDDLDAVRNKHRVVDSILMHVLHERVERLTRQYAELTFSVSGRARLRRHLLELHWQRGEATVWTTQQALGDAIGASRQSVNAWLRADVRAGFIEPVSSNGRYGVRVLDPDGLEAANRTI